MMYEDLPCTCRDTRFFVCYRHGRPTEQEFWSGIFDPDADMRITRP